MHALRGRLDLDDPDLRVPIVRLPRSQGDAVPPTSTVEVGAERSHVGPFTRSESRRPRTARPARESSTVRDSPLRAIDSFSHPLGERLLGSDRCTEEDCHFPSLGRLRLSQTVVPQWAGKTVALRTLKLDHLSPVHHHIDAGPIQDLARRAFARAGLDVDDEILRAEQLADLRNSRLVVKWMRRLLVAILGCKPLVAPSHAIVGDESVDFHVRQVAQIRFAVVASIRRNYRVLGKKWLNCRDNRSQELLLGSRPVGLGLDDDLMLRVHGSHARVSLDDALGGRHPGTLVVGPVALTHVA